LRKQRLFLGGRHLVGFGLLRDNQVLDFVVGGLGNNLFAHEIGFDAVGAAVDDLLRIGVADSGKFFELIFGGAVDVEFVGRGFRCPAEVAALSAAGWAKLDALSAKIARSNTRTRVAECLVVDFINSPLQ